MKTNIRRLPEQSILDFLLTNTGSIDSMFEFLVEQGISYNEFDTLPSIINTNYIKNNTTDYYLKKGYKVVSFNPNFNLNVGDYNNDFNIDFN